MYQIGIDVIVVDKNDLDHYNWIGKIVEIDSHATEGDCYGVHFDEDEGGPVFFFREQDIASIDLEKERRAWEADMKDMQQIKNEWRTYRLEGDESPPTPPSQLK